MTASTRFSDQLRAEHADTWDAAVTHRFVQELFAGTLPDARMAEYLVQDYRFADGFMALLGTAVATADNYPARRRFAQFLGEVAGDEDTYFVEAMAELGAQDGAGEAAVPDRPATAGFRRLFADAAASGSYVAVVSVLVVCEWLYLDWATRPENTAQAADGRPERHVHAEWVRLHDYPDFHDLVGFLRDEVDRVGESDPQVAREYFGRTVDLELAFFEESLPAS
ncbi:TenA family protein [Corynebacterium sp. AOP40-9SA-29]|uniref:TenA family protein n=1 Tax=Corynebacterium sp. AOP40-9SA-29 TaxID=3457677 RepID=UPI0040346075